MTIEVKELTINATIARDGDQCPDEEKAGDGLSEYDKTEIISQCTAQVLSILNGMQER